MTIVAIAAGGALGGFTTFSTFSVDALDLVRDGYMGRAAAYVVVSVVLCLSGTALGVILARAG